MRNIIVTIVVILLIGTGFVIYKNLPNTITPTYEIDGKMVPAKYFGNEAVGDLNKDGKPDKVFLITYDGGGSGTFYYAVASIWTDAGYQNTNAFFIGDRIAPQSNEIWDQGEIHINFAERRRGEPMTVQPSQGAVTLLRVTPDNRLVGLME